ncbi:hypothetical protein PUN28_018252 [Cardiocondyla obscurior]|uniref:Uncharacterized protein n=1 Tax=Cardiocondyla obscurior TaxID=286306 RepID=A0AAW2EGI3_9HYME
MNWIDLASARVCEHLIITFNKDVQLRKYLRNIFINRFLFVLFLLSYFFPCNHQYHVCARESWHLLSPARQFAKIYKNVHHEECTLTLLRE